MIYKEAHTYLGLTLSPCNSEVLNKKDCEFISNNGIVNSS